MSGQPFASVINHTLTVVADFLPTLPAAMVAKAPSVRISTPATRMFRTFIDDLPKAIDGLQSGSSRGEEPLEPAVCWFLAVNWFVPLGHGAQGVTIRPVLSRPRAPHPSNA